MAFGDTDLAAMLADFGVPVVIGATTIAGIRHRHDELQTALGAPGEVYLGVLDAVDVATATLPALAAEGLLTVDGVSYRLRHQAPQEDGTTRLFLSPA